MGVVGRDRRILEGIGRRRNLSTEARWIRTRIRLEIVKTFVNLSAAEEEALKKIVRDLEQTLEVEWLEQNPQAFCCYSPLHPNGTAKFMFDV